jgi:hypothetical protein
LFAATLFYVSNYYKEVVLGIVGNRKEGLADRGFGSRGMEVKIFKDRV